MTFSIVTHIIIITLSTMTLHVMSFSIMTLRITIISIMTLIIMILTIMTLHVEALSTIKQNNDTHSDTRHIATLHLTFGSMSFAIMT
jgi:hypothetical protein